MAGLFRSPSLALLSLLAFFAASPAPPAMAQRPPPGRRGISQHAESHETTSTESDPSDEGPNAYRPRISANRRTGFELELHGLPSVEAGRSLNLRGVAYEVIGLAGLRALPRARVVATLEAQRGDHVVQLASGDTSADASGRFSLSLAVPRDAPSSAHLTLSVGTGQQQARSFEFDVTVRSPYRLEFLTDRLLYEPGETIHAWARLLDATTGAPIGGRRVEISVGAEGRSTLLGTANVSTSPAGVASLDIPVPANAPFGTLTASAELVGEPRLVRADEEVRIGRRTLERLMAIAHLEQSIVAPGARLSGQVQVRAPSGAPVRGARVEVHTSSRQQPLVVETDAQGVAAFALNAPTYMAEPIQLQALEVRVSHRAYGSTRTRVSFTMARVPYTIEAVAAGGGLVPEVAGTVYLTLTDPAGNAPPAGTPVSVTGPAVQGGTFRGQTDRHGVVAVPMRPPRGVYAAHDSEASNCGEGVATSFDVRVESQVPVAARLCARVAPHAQVSVRTAAPVVAPGGRVEVSIERRPSARGRPVAVDLLHMGRDRRQSSVIASVLVPGGDSHAQLTLPPGLLGPVAVRARPVEAAGTAEGTGSTDVVLVRPSGAFRLALAPEREVYPPRERARVLVRTPQGLQGGHLALVVRDLAAHGGEHAWSLRWLDAVREGVSDPSTPEAQLLLRVALAAMADEDPAAVEAPPLHRANGEGVEDEETSSEYDAVAAAERGDMRDPFARRDELLRRGLMPVMRALEEAVERATAEDTEGIVTRAPRGFDPAVIHTLVADGMLDEDRTRTLGGGELTLAMLQTADPSFTFDRVARRVARRRLVQLLVALSAFVDPGRGRQSPVAGEPPERWLSRMVQRGVIDASALRDPWGGVFALHRVGPGHEAVAFAVAASGWELRSPGPDRVLGTADDVRDPFERVVPAGTVYALASGEDELMRSLAALDPGRAVLEQVALAYRRVSERAAEEEAGEAVSARESEMTPPQNAVARSEAYDGDLAQAAREGGWGRGGSGDETIGLGRIGTQGYGAGSGSGFGRGSGSVRRRTRLGPGTHALASLVRERFPATLHVVAQAPIDPSGTTVIEVPLADALTTYRVEAIAWTNEGWTDSASTELRVDQDAVVDAPVPPFVRVGDALRLPLRVSNRSQRTIRARVSVAAEGGLEISAGPALEVDVPPGDAREVVVSVVPQRAGHGSLVVRALDAQTNQPLDSARRPMSVFEDARPVRMAAEALVEGRATLLLDVPRDASFRAEGSVRLTVGPAIFGDARSWGPRASDATWPAWTLAMAGRAAPQELLTRIPPINERTQGEWLGRALAAMWLADTYDDAVIARALVALTRTLDGYEHLPRTVAHGPEAREAFGRLHAEQLLGLAPAYAAIDRRPALARSLRDVLARLRRSVESNTTPADGSAERYARAAAALALTENAPSARALEFMRRAARGLVRSADETFVEADAADPSSRARPTAMYGLAALATGDRSTAFMIARTLGRWSRQVERWSAETRALASAVLVRLTTNASGATRAMVSIDGRVREVPLVHGMASVSSRELSTPGRHEVTVTLPAGTVLVAQAEARYGRPWSALPAAQGPFALTLEGTTGARDNRAALVLRVQNRGPRVIATPVVEVDLPAGAELDEDARRAIQRRVARVPTLSDRTLVLPLRALAPGGFVRIPLPIRWSVGGRLRGLGVGAYVSDEPGAGTTVMASRTVEIADRGEEPTSANAEESR